MTAPGVRVCSPKMNSEFVFWEMVWSPKRTGAGGGVVVVVVGAEIEED